MSGGTLAQPYVFIAAIYGGLICGALYCAFRRVRKLLGAGRVLSCAIDGVFALLSMGICLVIMYETTLLELRIYHFIGIGMGFAFFLAGIAPIIRSLWEKTFRRTIDKFKKKSDNE